ncbi:MAG: methionine ABC transporter ATP-binding protein [Coxiellaceae bacterium]|nr:methionine ABC transporter ATP-binding protein [Coxiellaceae bacterium]
MIKLTNINKSYDTKAGRITALSDINLEVRPGEICGVIGRSGAGKSTLIRCVNLLERPTSGSVEVNGQELMALSDSALREARHHIGMVFQHFNLLSTRTVYENVALPLQLLNKSKSEIDQAVKPLLALTGLEQRAQAYPSQLSGGQKQRVAIARALSTKPSVLLCDEMTSALDPETTASILDLVKDINQQMNLSILLITHEMGVIKSIADHVAVLDDGRIIEQSDVVSLFKHPKTAIAKTFTESISNSELPALLHKQLRAERMQDGHTVIRVAFTGRAAAEPVIDDLVKHFKIRINILQANLEFLRTDTIGMMVVTVWGEEEETQCAIDALKQKGLTVEVLGYVAADDWILI